MSRSLDSYQFEAVRTEKLTLKEETELFANAEVVVGAHGAGFANLLFCHPNCVMVEFFPHRFTSNWLTTRGRGGRDQRSPRNRVREPLRTTDEDLGAATEGSPNSH